jgi:omega-amidase
MKAAICQIKNLPDKAANISKAAKMIDAAKSEGADMVVLPEIFNSPYEIDLFPDFAEAEPSGPTLDMLAGKAARHKLLVIGGSVPEKIEGSDRVYNTCFVFDETGKIIARHRKVHLFDISIKEKITVTESDVVEPGDEFVVFEWNGFKIGLLICYDIRFPEAARLLALEGAQIIAVPAAFNTTTGPAHWHLNMRTRAVENQVYLLAASPARNMQSAYHAYGHSLVVGPWGKILAEAGEDEEIIYAKIDKDHLEKVRQQLPLLKHRRTDLYSIERKK